MVIDTSTDFGAGAAHLQDDQVVWLTTVGPDQTPQPSPVWFLWDGETPLIYSQPGTPKLRNIGQHPRVSLNFNCTSTAAMSCSHRRRLEGRPEPPGQAHPRTPKYTPASRISA